MSAGHSHTLPPPPPSRHQKRTYLINARFQVKYTAMLVAVVAAVMIALGWIIGVTANTATTYAQIATEQAEKAMKESRANNQLTQQNVLLGAQGNADLIKMINDDLAETDRQAAKDLADVQARKQAIEAQRRLVKTILFGGGGTLIVVLALMGIFITHRVVGPVHKLKRLLRRIGTGRLAVNERLRRGDELGDLFETFVQMVWSLKALQRGRLATLDATMKKAQATGAAPEVLEGLRALRAQMALGLPPLPAKERAT